MDSQHQLSERPHIPRNGGEYMWADLADWPPTFADLHRYAASLRYTDKALREFVAHWTERDWVSVGGRPIRDANLLLRTHARELIKDGTWVPRATTTHTEARP